MAEKIKAPRLAPIVLLALIMLAVGTVFYKSVEQFSWLDSVYYCVMLLTTVGNASIELTTETGKIFTIFYVIFGVAIIASAANYLVQHVVSHHYTVHLPKVSAKEPTNE